MVVYGLKCDSAESLNYGQRGITPFLLLYYLVINTSLRGCY